MNQDSIAPEIEEKLKSAIQWIPTLREEIARIIVGQHYLVDRLLVGLLANGHVLLEGVPGLAKNTQHTHPCLSHGSGLQENTVHTRSATS